jgi:hypothetical protein
MATERVTGIIERLLETIDEKPTAGSPRKTSK